MSLKAFHILFITMSFLLAVGSGFLTWRGYEATGDMVQFGMSLFSFVMAVVIVIYGFWFLKKTKGLIL